MKKEKIYKIKITYKHGNKDVNKLLRTLDLGIEGVVVPDKITLNTTTKPTKKMIDRYKNALIQASEESNTEVFNINVYEVSNSLVTKNTKEE